MAKVQLEIDMVPRGERMNAFLAELKRALGSLGDGIELIDLSAFEKEFEDAEQAVGEYDEKLAELMQRIQELEDEADKGGGFLEKMFAFEALEGAGEALDKFSAKGVESGDAMRKAAAATGLVGDELEQLGDDADEAFRQGIGENVAEATRAIAYAQKQVGDFLNPGELVAFTRGMEGVAEVFDGDINEAIGKSRTLMANFGTSGTDTVNLVSLMMRDANTAMGDAMDSLDEYSQHLHKMGYTAEESVGLATRAVENGARDVDKVFDSSKEAQIRIMAGDATNALKGISGPVSAEIQKIVQAGQQGQISIKEVIQRSAQLTEEAFDSGQISEAMRSQLQVAIAGAPAEDIGAELYSKIFASPIDVEAVRAKAAEAGAAVNSAVGPVTWFEQAQRDAEVFATKASETFAPYIGGAGSVLQSVSQIGPGLSLLQDKFGVFDKAAGLMKGKLLPSILALIPGLGAQTAATGAATGATATLNATMLLNPVFLIVAGIAALTAAYFIFSDSTKEIGDATSDANKALADLDQTIAASDAAEKQKANLTQLADEYDRLKDATDPESQKRFAEVAGELAQKVPSAADAVDVFDEAGRKVGETYRISTNDVRALADEAAKMASENKADALGALDDQAQGLADSMHEVQAQVADLRKERDELAAKGLMGDDVDDDLKDVRKELVGQRQELNAAEKTVRELVARYQGMGLSVEEIAKRTGFTTEEVKKFSSSLGDAEGKAGAVKGATDGVGAAAARAKMSVQDLAAAYEAMNSAAQQAYSQGFNAIRSLQEEQRASQRELAQINQKDLTSLADAERQKVITRKTFLEQRLKDLPGEIKRETDAAKSALAEQRRLQREDTLLKLRVGEIDFNVTDLSTQAAQIRREIGNILFDLSNAKVADEIVRAQAEIDQKLKGDLATIDGQIASTRKQIQANREAGDPSKVIKGADQLFAALNEKRAALEKQAAQERLDVERELREKQRDAYAKILSDMQKAALDAAKSEAESLRDQEDRIKGDSDEALNERLELRRRAIAEQTRVEIEGLVTSNAEYVQAYIELQEALNAQTAASTDAERAAAQTRVEAALGTLGELRARLLEEDRGIAAARDRQAVALGDATDEIMQARFDREIKMLDRKHAKELAAYKRAADDQAAVIESARQLAEELADQFIDKDVDRRLEQLEAENAAGLRSQESYELEKTKIAENGERQREAAAARARGAALEAERQAGQAEIALQIRQLEERKAAADKAGRTEESAQIGQQLDDAREALEEKGDVLTGLAGDLQGEFTGIIGNLFAGRPEEVKAGFKGAFQEIAGALQTLASAKATEVILSMIGPTGWLGFIASFAARPLVDQIINATLGPVLNNLMSFPTGGRVDSPTMFVAGDASRLGGRNREWITTDDQLHEILDMAAARSASHIVPVLYEIVEAIRGIDGRVYVLESDVVDAVDHGHAVEATRIVGRPAGGFGPT